MVLLIQQSQKKDSVAVVKRCIRSTSADAGGLSGGLNSVSADNSKTGPE